MQFRLNQFAAACLVGAVVLASSVARANVVANGGFETGDFSGWTQFGDLSFSGVDVMAPQSGTYAAFFGSTGGLGGISQTFSTVAGGHYLVQFWLQNEADVTGASTPNTFEFDWGGAPVMTLSNAPAFGYRQYGFDLFATSSSTTIRFGFENLPAFFDLDNAAVTLPEPSGLALLGLAGGLAGIASRRRLRVVATA